MTSKYYGLRIIELFSCNELGNSISVLPTLQPIASRFNFFAPAQKKLKFFCTLQNGTFAFGPTAQADPLGKIKRAIFSQRTHNNDALYPNSQVYPCFIAMKHNLFDKNDQK